MLDFIRKNFDKLTNKEISIKLGTNEDSVKNACRRYKIKKDGGTIVKNKYKEGILINPNKGKKSPSTTKRNLENNPMKNPKTVEKMKKTKIRLYKEGKIKPTKYWLGKKNIKLSETRKRLFKEGKLKVLTPFKKGQKPWNEGKRCPQLYGKNNGNWRGGKSFEPYSYEFNKALKEKIKKRDNYECQECRKKFKLLAIHHIDYNKNNNFEFNLISLCLKCHGKTSFNRKHWANYFQMQMFIKYLLNPKNVLIFNENKQLIGVK